MTKKPIVLGHVYSPQEAAEILDVSSQTIVEYCRAGKIAAQKIGEWRILGESIANFLVSPPVKYDKRRELITKFADYMDKLVELHKENPYFSSGTVLMQSINLYADDRTLEKINDDLQHQIQQKLLPGYPNLNPKKTVYKVVDKENESTKG